MEQELQRIYDRIELVLGKEAINRIKSATVCICGIGGVGSFTLEALTRIGVGHIIVIDKDVVDVTNINRQIIATSRNIGMPKVEEAKKRVNEINPEIKVTTIHDYISGDNIDNYINESINYVVDAIDSVDSKIAIIQKCKSIGINVISSMGMGNKIDPLKIKIADISRTEMCPLAKVMRKRLREMKISKVKVVYSTEQPIKNKGNVLGSVSYVPSVAGLIIASEVVKQIINN